MTGTLLGQTIALDMLFGTLASLLACLLEAFFSRFLCVAIIWPCITNGIIVGLELYYLFEGINMPLYACMGFVALGELIVMAVGYAVFMIIIRNRGAMNAMRIEKHAEVKF